MTKRVLVTGASGFIGRPLVQALLRAGYAVRITTRGAPSFSPEVEVAVVPDLSQPIDWAPALRGIDIVIHLAGLAHVDTSGSVDIREFDVINRRATKHFLRAAKEAGTGRFIFVSSVRAQTGASAPGVVREDDEALPTDNYGRSKLAAEAAVRASGVPFTILRPVAIYGPHPRGNIKTLVRLARAPIPLPFLGLTARRSFLGIDNFISAVLFVLNEPATLGETFLVADPAPTTVSEMFVLLRAAQGRPAHLFHVPPVMLYLVLLLFNRGPVWGRLSGDLVVDPGKLQALGWRPPADTYKGVVDMVRAERLQETEMRAQARPTTPTGRD